MNTKDNQRTRLSKILFKNAIVDIIKEKGSVTKVTVKELCERAGLNRSTFYAHYNEPKDLLEEIENELLLSTEEHLKQIGAQDDGIGAYKYLLSFLQYIKTNDNLFRTLLVDSADPDFRSKFMSRSIFLFIENLRVELPKETEQYIFSYILNGNTGIIIQWIRSGYLVDENTIVKLLLSINSNALKNIK